MGQILLTSPENGAHVTYKDVAKSSFPGELPVWAQKHLKNGLALHCWCHYGELRCKALYPKRYKASGKIIYDGRYAVVIDNVIKISVNFVDDTKNGYEYYDKRGELCDKDDCIKNTIQKKISVPVKSDRVTPIFKYKSEHVEYTLSPNKKMLKIHQMESTVFDYKVLISDFDFVDPFEIECDVRDYIENKDETVTLDVVSISEPETESYDVSWGKYDYCGCETFVRVTCTNKETYRIKVSSWEEKDAR